MAVNIKFDLAGNPELPTIILATRSGNKLGQLDVDADSVELTDRLNDVSELSFTIHKPETVQMISRKGKEHLISSDDYVLKDSEDVYLLAKEVENVENLKMNLWEKVTDFKLVYCKEWDTWFEITVELDEETETIKTVFGKQLGQAELSQLMLYNIEINTEDDIARDDYKIAILYDAFDTEASILHRLLKDKAPHYSIIHVDSTIARIQRTFSFDGTSIYDAFQEIAEEIGCLFVFHSDSDENGKPRRVISVYDLESNCNSCGYRGEFIGTCPECGSAEIKAGYGDDTTIFVTADELAENIQLTTDTDAVKNCFKLEAGDDLMTATIRNCNPNGTDYLWYISDAVKTDMSDDLVEKLESYDKNYSYYQKEHIFDLNAGVLTVYNALVRKYQFYNEELKEIQTPIVGYPALMQAYYNTIDLELYLKSSLMPSVEMSNTSALIEARKLISSNLSPVSSESVQHMSLATANSIILSMAKILVDSRYKVEINESSFDEGTKRWTGNFKITNYSDEEDVAISSVATVRINDDYSNFVQQKIEKALNKENTDDLSVSGLFEKTGVEFADELRKYSLNCLTSFHDVCQTCIDILIDQGVGNEGTWEGQAQDLYNELYAPYLNKLNAIEKETKLRQEEINLITGVYDINDNLTTYGLQSYVEEAKNYIHNQLDFEQYLGSDLWFEFCSFRREDKYSNSNYISDGLNNVELFDNALKFIEVAEKEIYKSAELQHSISSTLKNLLTIKKFKPLVKNFKVGNWLRILIDDEIYRLRLIEYSISYGSFNDIPVEFSDITKLKSSVNSIQGVIKQASKMATSYDSVQKQAAQGKKVNSILDGWSLKGMDVTNTKIIQGADNQTQTWDNHGMLFKKYDEVTDSYNDTQLKIVNSTMAITDDGWKTVKTAVGEYYYFDPETNELKKAYGVNGEVLVGKLILGEQLGIYNSSGNLTFNDNGLEITNGVNSFRVNPNDSTLFSISNSKEDILYVDDKGKLYIRGDGSGLDISGTAVIAGLGTGATIINGDCITTGTIDAREVTIRNINASNITTGTMSADRINLTGAITWDDLSDDARGEISSQISGSAVSLPSYIKSTYIDSTRVESPTIIGGEFYAVNEDSYLKMVSDGWELYTTGISIPKAALKNNNTNIMFTLGAGDAEGENVFYIEKTSRGVDIIFITADGGECGFTLSNDGNIHTHGSIV